MEENQIVIYTSKEGEVYIEARVKNESIWLSQKQIAELFNTDRTVIGRHIRNIFSSNELDKKGNVQKMHFANSDKPVLIYNLDTIISIGYRVNSKKATQFRIWATKTLKSYLLKGYALNERLLREQNKRLEEIRNTILMIGEKSSFEVMQGRESGLLGIISEYARSWRILDQFDRGQLAVNHLEKKVQFEIEYNDSCKVIAKMKETLARENMTTELFGREVNHKLEGIIASVNQTYDGEDLYPSIEEKAAHLLYFLIKDHPFADGNKRIASMIFLLFLKKNHYFYRQNSEVKLNDNSIIVLALLVAVSSPREKEEITKLIINLLRE